MELSKQKPKQWAQIKMPDGSIVEGACSDFDFYNTGLVWVEIDGVTYRCSKERIVIVKERDC